MVRFYLIPIEREVAAQQVADRLRAVLVAAPGDQFVEFTREVVVERDGETPHGSVAQRMVDQVDGHHGRLDRRGRGSKEIAHPG